jgi:hypothetical protein
MSFTNQVPERISDPLHPYYLPHTQLILLDKTQLIIYEQASHLYDN